MKYIKCGCTQEAPESECEMGKALFADASQAFQNLFDAMTIAARDECWTLYALARLAYKDHLNGWEKADIKVQKRTGFWMVHARSCGQWIFLFGTKDVMVLIVWLRERGYQQYVHIKSNQAQGHLLGYYRKKAFKGEYTIEEKTSSENTSLPAEDEAIEQKAASHSLFDLKTRVAIRIALLVAQLPSTLTLVDRLLVQQRAASLLRVYGVQVEAGDERVLRELLDEAVQQKKVIKGHNI